MLSEVVNINYQKVKRSEGQYILLYFLLLELPDIFLDIQEIHHNYCVDVGMCYHIIFLLFLFLISIHVVSNSALLILR